MCQNLNIFLDLLSVIRVSHEEPVRFSLKHLGCRLDIFVLLQNLLHTFKRLMCLDSHSMRIIDQSISCNTGRFMISFAESSVNHDQLAVRAYRLLSFFCLNRCMSVNDMRNVGIQVKFTQDHIAGLFAIIMLIVWIRLLMPCFLIGNKRTLKGFYISA